METVSTGRERMRRALKGEPADRPALACIESARSSRFVLSTGCEIPFKAPIENIRALARAAQAGY